MDPFTVEGLTSIINQLLPEPHAGLLAGLLFGTKASLSRDFYNALVASGTLHIIALSGMNITIMEDIVGKLLLPVVGKKLATILTLVMILWFVWFVGPASSIVRAAIMGSLSLIAILFGRQYWALLSWIIACGIMLIINFQWFFEISFQLSALATLGIILFGKNDHLIAGPVARNISRQCSSSPVPDAASSSRLTASSPPDTSQGIGSMRSEVRAVGNPFLAPPATTTSRLFVVVRNLFGENLRLTLAAQVFTIPLTMLYFRRISLVSPLTNLAIGWVITPITFLGWVTALVGWVLLYAGQVIAWIDWIFLEYLIRTVQIISRLPFASFTW